MRCILIEPFSGVSGDMLLSALIDVGADENEVRKRIEDVSGLKVSFERCKRGFINALRMLVEPYEETEKTELSDIIKLIRDSDLPDEVMKTAEEVFVTLAKAENVVHNEDVVHLHEVGQKDAIADVVGVCTALHLLGNLPLYYVPPIITGKGVVQTSHGTLPVPAPATLEIIRECKLITSHGSVMEELLTPTGAALVGVLSRPLSDSYVPVRTISIGYGAGTKELAVPNVLRARIVELLQFPSERVEMIEANVDDLSGEELGSLREKLEKEALDVVLVPALMKKGRMGTIIKAVVREGDGEKIANLIIEEGGSLGVRIYNTLHRAVAKRDIREVQFELEGVKESSRVKLGLGLNGRIVSVKAEYEDAKEISDRRGIPIKRVIRAIEDAGWRLFSLEQVD